MKKNEEKIKASACIITYNHENYIAQAIEGALSQEVDFNYEIVISEDCSTDKTREIVKEYQSKYPDKIKLFLNDKNLGLIGNWEKSLKICRGEYIAILEGDDYWTDPKKIKKQVDFLENRPDYTLTVHNTIVVDENNDFIRRQCEDGHPEIISLESLVYGKSFSTCSILFRRYILDTLPDWFFTLEAADWTLPIFCGLKGKVKYFKDTMGAYRKHKKGASYNQKIKAEAMGKSSFAFSEKSMIKTCALLNKYFNFKYDKQLRRQLIYWHNNLVDKYLKIQDALNAKKYARKTIKEIIILNHWKNGWLTKKRFIKLVLISFFPSLFKPTL